MVLSFISAFTASPQLVAAVRIMMEHRIDDRIFILTPLIYLFSTMNLILLLHYLIN